MTPTTREQEARELLAQQYDRDDTTMAKKIREGTCRNEEANRAIPAIIAALTREQREGGQVLAKALYDPNSGRAATVERFNWPNHAGFVNVLLVRASEQPQPEAPGAVAFASWGGINALNACRNDDQNGLIEVWARPTEHHTIPLYTTPPAPVDVRVRTMLRQIADWELPPTKYRWINGNPMNYEAAFGSVGARDYMRKIATDALALLDGQQAGVESDLVRHARRAIALLHESGHDVSANALTAQWRREGFVSIENDPIVGHKTLGDGKGGLRHEPLRQSEAEAFMRQAEAADARRKELMPDEATARRLFFDAWLRLKDFGWREAMYCPKDGRDFDALEAGSTGIHRCYYEGEWPTGRYWVYGDCDIWPSRPVLFREIAPTTPQPRTK